jgi:hypothetical protein
MFGKFIRQWAELAVHSREDFGLITATIAKILLHPLTSGLPPSLSGRNASCAGMVACSL